MKELESQVVFTKELEDDQALNLMEDSQVRIIEEWCSKWISQVFSDMVPCTRWKTAHRDVRVGDVGSYPV